MGGKNEFRERSYLFGERGGDRAKAVFEEILGEFFKMHITLEIQVVQ